MRKLISLALLFMLITLAQANETLNKLSPVKVSVFGLKDLEFKEELRTKIELSLRKSGISVCNEDSNANLFLDLEVSVLNIDQRGELTGYTYHTSLVGQARSKLVINDEHTLSLVFSRANHGIVSKNLYELIRGNTRVYIDDFCNQYLKANTIQK